MTGAAGAGQASWHKRCGIEMNVYGFTIGTHGCWLSKHLAACGVSDVPSLLMSGTLFGGSTPVCVPMRQPKSGRDSCLPRTFVREVAWAIALFYVPDCEANSRIPVLDGPLGSSLPPLTAKRHQFPPPAIWWRVAVTPRATRQADGPQKKAERHAAAAAVSSSMGKSPSQAATGRRQQQPKHSLHHHHHEWQPSTLMRWYRDNQIELPLAILTLLLAGAAIAPPSASSYFHNIVLPAYPLTADRVARHPPNSTPLDVAFVVFGIIIWTLVRAVTIDHVLKPLARKLKCTRSHVERFGEQGWLGLYYSVSWSIGMWFVYRSPFWMNVEQFWIDYPHEYLSGEFKAYYLLQLAFWIQQVLDYTQMLVHHFVTCALIISSYYTNFTRVGCAILATMDVGDIFLSTAKCLNYIRWRKTCDAMFVAFVGVWIYSRHYVYNVIVASIYRDIPKLLSMDVALDLVVHDLQGHCQGGEGQSAEDTRSDEESGAEDEEDEEGVETDKVAEPKKFK
ncbi:TLC domain-domain-containing protein [Catenaria anguillulae PL171]|uniref:TLC domain-domain-containing protein n=1 Tax=Catenaria anguillulae PL171 TaxID=765915 RepID=A0A1Y2HQY9_9FUNG|nr:TLC domain-domain-containing protein [Catenaria anguillulae PL171]